MTALAVFVGGGLGALVRWGLGIWLNGSGQASGLPKATLLANLLAVAAMGLVVFSSTKFALPARTFWLVGFCGGLSTFSTFSLENYQLLKMGQWEWALANVAVSVLGCLAVLWLLARS